MYNGERDEVSQEYTCHPDSKSRDRMILQAPTESAGNSNIWDDDALGRLLSFVPDLFAAMTSEAEGCHSDHSLQRLQHLHCH